MYNLYICLIRLSTNKIFLRYFTHFVRAASCLDKFQFSYYLRLYCIGYIEEHTSVMTGIFFSIFVILVPIFSLRIHDDTFPNSIIS